MKTKKIVKEIEDIAVELQEHITLPIHSELRIKLFELADKFRKGE